MLTSGPTGLCYDPNTLSSSLRSAAVVFGVLSRIPFSSALVCSSAMRIVEHSGAEQFLAAGFQVKSSAARFGSEIVFEIEQSV